MSDDEPASATSFALPQIFFGREMTTNTDNVARKMPSATKASLSPNWAAAIPMASTGTLNPR